MARFALFRVKSICLCFLIARVTSNCDRSQSDTVICNGDPIEFPVNASMDILILKRCELPQTISAQTFSNIIKLRALLIDCPNNTRLATGWTRSLQKVNLEIITLSGNFISQLPNDTFNGLEMLDTIRLNNNQLQHPEQLGFSNATSFVVGSNIRNLWLNENNIKKIINNAFFHLGNLDVLVLSYNRIEVIEPLAFQGLRKLRYLNLCQNKLAKISANTFSTILQLQSLDLSSNYLDNEVYGAIDHLVNVDVLQLGNNRITRLNETTINQLHKMRTLMFGDNQITAVSAFCFYNLTQLGLLDLQNNNISSIESDAFFGLKNVVNLWLSNNSIIDFFPDHLSNLTSLRTVKFDANKLTSIPNLRGLQVLTMVNFSRNLIDEIKDDDFMDQNQTIMELDLSFNRLKFISQKAINFPPLFSLDLSHNQIESIEENALNLTLYLRMVKLQNNRLSSIKNIFNYSSPLQFLNLSTNYFRSFSWSDFPPTLLAIKLDNNLIQSVIVANNTPPPQNLIEIIHLQNNRLQFLKANQIPSSFVFLRLDHNNISRINPNTFLSCNRWKYLNLQYNNFRELCSSWLPDPPPPPYNSPLLFLAGNPFQCTCEMSWMARYRVPSISDKEKVTCTGQNPLQELQVTAPIRDQLVAKRFWCKTGPGSFNYPDSNTCFCSESKVPVSSYCELKCPDNCTCYRDVNRKEVTVRCFDAELNAVPSGSPDDTQSLLIQNNNISSIKRNDFRNFKNLFFFFFASNQLRHIEEYAFERLSKLNQMYLGYNQLTTLRKHTFTGLNNVVLLYLGKNQLQTIEEYTFLALPSMTHLNLANNRLIQFPVWTLNVSRVVMGNNPWSCECEFVNKFRQWIQNSTLVADIDNLTCSMTSDNSLVSMVTINQTVCLEFDNHFKFSLMTIVIACAVGIFLPSIIIGFLLFYFRKEIQVLIYAKYGFRFGQHGIVSTDKPYDAFVSYSSFDDQFLVDNILPGLETEIAVPYRLCLHQRDFAAGAFITDAILEAVERSKATVLLLSQNFLDSEWCRFEFKAAHLQMLRDPQSKIIVVLLQPTLPKNLDPEIKLYLKTNTYIVWGDKLFWKRLYFALPKPTGDHAQAEQCM